jgi:hypothetical protein
VNRLKTVDPVLFALISSGRYTKTRLRELVFLGLSAAGGGNRIGRWGFRGGAGFFIYDSLRDMLTVADCIDWCTEEKCTQFVPKVKKDWYRWPLIYCSKCPEGTDEVNVDENGEVWR